jgi:hypothetical protein
VLQQECPTAFERGEEALQEDIISIKKKQEICR